MADFKFELNRDGVRELLQSAEMQGIVQELAEGVSGRAAGMTGLEYKVTAKAGRNRATATVSPDSAHAYYENLQHNTLLKALGGGA